MKTLLLVIANIKKRKSAAISLFLLVLFATLMLNVGLSIFLRLDTFFDEKTVELNGAHYIANFPNNESLPEKEEFIKNYSYTAKTEKEESIALNGASIPYGNGELAAKLIILNADKPRAISTLKLIDKLNTPTSNMIYLPYTFKSGGGYKLGDTINIENGKEKYFYTIGGFFEDTVLGSTMNGTLKAFMPQQSYMAISAKASSDIKYSFISAILTDSSKALDLSYSFDKKFLTGYFTVSTTIDIVNSETNYTMPIKLIAAMLIVFALIILVVSLIVIKFRVSNSIEDDMVNIGSLKGAGYTSRQIIISILMQFTLISATGGIVGITLSYAMLPMLGGIISSAVGLLWTSQIDIFSNLFSLFLVVILVSVSTLGSAVKVRRITPIAALRGGVQTHNFKKNHFPLDKAKGNLQLLLGLKSLSSSRKQNLLIILIVASLCFACIFSSIMYYNFCIDKSSLFNFVGAERCNVVIYTKSGVDTSSMFADINKMVGVKKTGTLALQDATINNKKVTMYVSDDYKKVDWDTVYKGAKPTYDNEIVISGMLAKEMNKEIGDSIKVAYGDKSSNYIITGLSQQVGNGGANTAAVTIDGYKKIYQEYEKRELSVYLDGINTKKFIENVKYKYDEQIFTLGNLDAAAESEMGSLINAITYTTILIIVMSLLVVSLILYLIIKALILKRRREFGIYKANGYTTFQLMTQIALSFIPIVGTGAVLGGIIGITLSNSMLSILFSGIGILNANFSVNIPAAIMICGGMVVTAYIVAMLVARRIKKITAYGLITE